MELTSMYNFRLKVELLWNMTLRKEAAEVILTRWIAGVAAKNVFKDKWSENFWKVVKKKNK